MTQQAEVQAQARYERLSEKEFVSYRRRENAVGGFFGAVRAVFDRRELLGQLVRRELVGKYKDSTLGVAWSLARPLAQLLIYYLVIGEFLGAARGIDNFAIFIFCGLTLYGLFSETLTMMTSSIVANAGLVKKVYLPREIFPLAALGASLFNFSIQFAILLIAALILGTIAFGVNLLFAVGALLVILIWVLGLGLALAAANVFMRDIQFVVDIVTMLLMWFSPIVYSWTFVESTFSQAGIPWLTEVYLANPITVAVIGFQEAFWAIPSGGELLPYLWLRMLIVGLVGLVVLWLGQRYFAKHQANFAQEL